MWLTSLLWLHFSQIEHFSFVRLRVPEAEGMEMSASRPEIGYQRDVYHSSAFRTLQPHFHMFVLLFAPPYF